MGLHACSRHRGVRDGALSTLNPASAEGCSVGSRQCHRWRGHVQASAARIHPSV